MFRSIALGGGGVRGGLHVGGLAALREIRGNLEFPDGIYGCSAGSIVATALAFHMSPETLRTMFEEEFRLSAILPSLRLSHIQEVNKRKGMFPMDQLEQTLQASFAKHGVDLSNKVIADAPQKLYIQATNMTTCRPVWFTGQVPLLKAILASCCIPLVFQPQILYGNVYVDGEVGTPCIHTLVPSDCLVFHIQRPRQPTFPSELEGLSFVDMLNRIMASRPRGPFPNNVILFVNELRQLQELTDIDKDALFRSGFLSVQRFFAERLA